jgi:hypothetical protein
VSDLEKRDKVAEAETKSLWAECFIAIRNGDEVRTLSGMIDTYGIEHEMDTGSFWLDNVAYSQLLNFGHTVTIHFPGRMVVETQTMEA